MSYTFIDLKFAQYYLERIGDELDPACVRGMQSAAMRALQVIVTRIIPARTPQPVDRGVYRAGWRAVPEPTGAVLENLEAHAPLIEYGVRAENVKIGRAMIEALAAWVPRKGLASEPKQAVKIAWAIAKAMKKRGIFNYPGRQGLGIVDELLRDWLPSILRDEIGYEIVRAINGQGGNGK